MRGNSFGKLFSLTSFGESHGTAMGVVIDGMPAGIDIDLKKLNSWMQRRAPGKSKTASSRQEQDLPKILSGIFENKTLGTPISIIVENKDQRSQDYQGQENDYRPGHADKTTQLKFGHRDHRGGGRASGRETVSRVIAGYFASLILPQLQIKIITSAIGNEFDLGDFKLSTSTEIDQFGFPLALNQTKNIESYLLNLKENGESAGGEVEILIKNCPHALGEPCFDKLKADFAKAIMSIGTCQSFGISTDRNIHLKSGSELAKDIQNYAGIEGGISNGELIRLWSRFRAPSTVGEKAKAGRHDPFILPRALVVIESMLYIVLADHYLRQNAYQI